MKKTYIKVLFLAFIASVLFCSSLALASDDIRFYVEAEVGGSSLDFDSGGHNAEPFQNTDDSSEEALITGIHFGAKLTDYLRADIGLNHRSDLDFTTKSYPTSDELILEKENL